MSAMKALTRAQSRRVDELAVDALAMDGLVLMENAGRNAAAAAVALLARRRGLEPGDARVAVMCGGGNNGGDGYVVARHLCNAGASVRVYTAVDPGCLRGPALANCRVAQAMGLAPVPARDDRGLAAASRAWAHAHLIVDGLLGTGFAGEVRPHMAALITACNAARTAGALVVALDVPSGLDCDTGRPAEPTVTADLTVTFVAPKVGFDRPEAAGVLGEVQVADIGAPPWLAERAAGLNSGPAETGWPP